MEQFDVFLSVGATATPKQEEFVRAVIERLRSEGLITHTVGRDTFSSDAPLKALTELMDRCKGTVVIALERTYFPKGVEKRGGPNEIPLSDIKLTTPWNQIEAAMAYCHEQPMMIILETGLKSEGLLEQGHGWYVQRITPEPASLNTMEFNGVLADWKAKVVRYDKTSSESSPNKEPSEWTIVEIIGALKPAQLWSIMTALAVLIGGAFTFGVKTSGFFKESAIPPAIHTSSQTSSNIPGSTISLNPRSENFPGTWLDSRGRKITVIANGNDASITWPDGTQAQGKIQGRLLLYQGTAVVPNSGNGNKLIGQNYGSMNLSEDGASIADVYSIIPINQSDFSPLRRTNFLTKIQ